MAKSPITDEMAALVGKIAADWNLLEMLLSQLIEGFLKTDQVRARIVYYSNAAFRGRRDLVVRLGQTFLADNHLEDFTRLMGRVDKHSAKRNHMVHGLYSASIDADPPTQGIIRETFPREFDEAWESGFEETTAEEATKKLAAIRQLIDDLTQFIERIDDADIEASPRIHRQPRSEPRKSGMHRLHEPND